MWATTVVLLLLCPASVFNLSTIIKSIVGKRTQLYESYLIYDSPLDMKLKSAI